MKYNNVNDFFSYFIDQRPEKYIITDKNDEPICLMQNYTIVVICIYCLLPCLHSSKPSDDISDMHAVIITDHTDIHLIKKRYITKLSLMLWIDIGSVDHFDDFWPHYLQDSDDFWTQKSSNCCIAISESHLFFLFSLFRN